MSIQIEMVCGGCGAVDRHKSRVKRAKLRCQRCGCKTLYTITTVARAGGLEVRNAANVRLWSQEHRVEVIRAYETAKDINAERRGQQETRVELRDGKEFVVTVLPEVKPPEGRPADTHFHFSDTGKQADAGVGRGPQRRKRRGR